MKKNAGALFCLMFFFSLPVWAQTPDTLPAGAGAPGNLSEGAARLRSFDEIFPGVTADRKAEIFRPEGLIRSVKVNEALEFIPAPASGLNLVEGVMKTDPSYLAESLIVLPYAGRQLSRLDAYNALGRISGLQGRLYNSHTRNKAIPLFEEATRLESEKRARAIPDPPPSRALPPEETVYIRLKDANFGNSYYRGNMSASPHGITYNLVNTRNLTYLLFTVMKEGRFSATLYMEPLVEGMLVYSVAGAGVSDFIDSLVDIPSAISKRLAVFIGWLGDGVTTVQ